MEGGVDHELRDQAERHVVEKDPAPGQELRELPAVDGVAHGDPDVDCGSGPKPLVEPTQGGG